jgi:hypothetical protein
MLAVQKTVAMTINDEQRLRKSGARILVTLPEVDF